MNLKKLLVLVIAVILVVVLYNAVGIYEEYADISDGGKEVTVEIPKGASGKTIAEILKDNKVIKSEIAFRLKLSKSPQKQNLNYGTFVMKENLGYGKIIDILVGQTAQVEGVTLLIPEGFSAEMIAERVEKLGLVSKEDFLNELENGKFDYDFIKDIPDNKNVKYKLQGYLFPNTYTIKKTATAHEIIDVLLGEFEKQYNELKKYNKDKIPMDKVITLASLIEREAKIDSERTMISGVLQNRIKEGMRLQIDASVVYAISDGMYDVDRVLYKDLEVNSPYNTYRNDGLPVGPICSPGAESIRAAMQPQSHSYLYYHTDTKKNDGSHIFTETLAAHNQTK